MIKSKTKNLGIIEAIKELKTMSLSDRLYYIHEQRLKEKRDREWIEDDMYEQGMEKGREDEREKNIRSFIETFRRNRHTDEQIVEELVVGYGLSREEAEKKLSSF